MSSTELTTICAGFPSLDVLIKFSDMIAKSGMVPKDYINKPDAVATAIIMGHEVGLKPLQAVQNIAVINGRPNVWGDAALSLVMTHPDFEYIKEWDFETIDKAKKATCEIKRKGQDAVIRSFSYADATTAFLDRKDGPWKLYKPRQCQMRARSFAMRDSFPDALKGISIAEESRDMPEEREINPNIYNDNKENLRAEIEKNKSNKEMLDTETGEVIVQVEIPPEPEFDEVSKAEENKEGSLFDTVMNGIALARTTAGLLQSMKLMRGLGEEERAKAGIAYNAKQNELKRT
jgi:hypothetical protein